MHACLAYRHVQGLSNSNASARKKLCMHESKTLRGRLVGLAADACRTGF